MPVAAWLVYGESSLMGSPDEFSFYHLAGLGNSFPRLGKVCRYSTVENSGLWRDVPPQPEDAKQVVILLTCVKCVISS